MNIQDSVTLSNGVKIPCVGFGTWKLLEDECVKAVCYAIDAGYRHIDTATAYRNEKSVGKAIQMSEIDRKELFVTDKLWNSSKGYEQAIKACKKSLDFLGMEYIDLYLIHWPRSIKHMDDFIRLNNDTWRAFETLYNDGLVRAIGVSNFLPHHLLPLMDSAKIMPMVDQLELNPQCPQHETVDFCRKHNIVTEAYSPLTRTNSFETEEMRIVSKKHNCSAAQVCLAWSILQGHIPLPKSSHADRIKENTDIFNITLDKEDLTLLEKLTSLGRVVADPDNPPF